MSFKNLFQSSLFRGILIGLGVAIAALLIFQAGLHVGYRKASFSFHGGDNFYRAFGEKRHQKDFMGMKRGDFPNAHGALGKIISIQLPTFILEDEAHVEKIVLIKDDTIIRKFRDTLQAKELTTDDQVVVFGAPNDQAQIEAKMIRIVPQQEEQDQLNDAR